MNYDELLAPVPGDEPAGPSSAYFEMRPQFEEMRREVTPEQAAETKQDLKNADWRGLERKTKETLAETTKDLRVAGYLLEALVKNHGFAGARDGLRLLRLLVDQCWERLNPPIDPEDPEVRAGPFNWIDDPDRGLRFPTTLRLTPLLFGRDRAFSFFECRPQGKDEAALEQRRQVDLAIETAAPESLTGVLEEIQGCQEELRGLTEDLATKIGAASPAMTAVRTTLEEIRTFLEQILQKRPDATAKTDTEASADGALAAGAAGVAGLSPGASRAEIYRQLGQAALALRELEPHSPIPYLLLRAVELGQMSFPQLMQELIRDANSLTELKREFGLKEAPPPSE